MEDTGQENLRAENLTRKIKRHQYACMHKKTHSQHAQPPKQKHTQQNKNKKLKKNQAKHKTKNEHAYNTQNRPNYKNEKNKHQTLFSSTFFFTCSKKQDKNSQLCLKTSTPAFKMRWNSRSIAFPPPQDPDLRLSPFVPTPPTDDASSTPTLAAAAAASAALALEDVVEVEVLPASVVLYSHPYGCAMLTARWPREFLGAIEPFEGGASKGKRSCW